MKKAIIPFSFAFCVFSLFFYSCIDKDYDWDSINKQIVFSPDGIDVPIGSLEKLYFNEEAAVENDLSNSVYRQRFKNFFSKDIYDMFTIKENGVDKGIGDIEFKATIFISIDKINDITATIKAEALDAYGDVVLELGTNTYTSDKIKTNQPFHLRIKQEEVTNLKTAKTLAIMATATGETIEIEPEDYLKIENMRFRSTGGISYELD